MKRIFSSIAMLLIILIISFAGSYSQVNTAGKVIWLIEPQFDEAWDFNESMAMVKKNRCKSLS